MVPPMWRWSSNPARAFRRIKNTSLNARVVPLLGDRDPARICKSIVVISTRTWRRSWPKREAWTPRSALSWRGESGEQFVVRVEAGDELVRAAVIEEVTAAATGLSDPDVGILLRLDVVGGSLRQSEIASALGWDRTRLSHQLTRMEDRGLLARRRTSSGVWVDISDVGKEAATSARPVHAAAVRRHLAEPLTPGQSAMLREILELLSSATE